MIERAGEKWVVLRNYGDFKGIGERCGVDPLIARVMVNRGGSVESSERYFYGGLGDLRNPLLMKDIEKARDMILEYEGGIGIASDYDCDGLFSGFSLHRAFDRLGIDNKIYVPDRVSEGYGLNKRIVKQAWDEGFRFLITCDNGISAGEAVDYAKELGMKVIVTDHHEVPYKMGENGERVSILPKADAIVNPKQADCGYPYKYLCGTGVVYFLIKLMYEKRGIPEEEMMEFTEYAAIATITDVMPLTEENRIIVKCGLLHLADTKNPGLRALIEVCGLDPLKISSYHAGFILGPCFNATGRISEIEQSIRLLSQKDYKMAQKMALEIKNVNEERKEMTRKGEKMAFSLLEGGTTADKENKYMGDSIICIYLNNIHESIVGLVAGKVRESYNKPVFVFTDGENGIKGSGRSVEAYNMFEGISKCSDLLENFGGHPMAAGLSMKKENYEEFKKRINENSGLKKEDLVHIVKIDADMPFGYITKELIKQLSLLEPFGKENEKPLFGESMVNVLNAKVLGKNRNVIRFFLINSRGTKMNGIYFGDGDAFLDELEEFYGGRERELLLCGQENSVYMTIIYSPEINEYRGEENIQIKINRYMFKRKGSQS